MARSRAICLSVLVLLLLVSGIFSEVVRRRQASRAENSASSLVAPPPVPEAKAAAGSYRMKCLEVRSFTGHSSQGQTGFDTDPCGWKEVVDGNGNRVWYRLFVQTTVVTSVAADPLEEGGSKVTFTARGRHAAVICKGEHEFPSPPPDSSVGNGYGSWSEWREAKRSALVTCDARSGVISFRPGPGDEERKQFDDGLSIALQVSEELNELQAAMYGTATVTHPLGGDGDGERGLALYSVLRRP